MSFAVFSDGTRIESPKPLAKALRRLRHRQRPHSRKQRGSRNRRKSAAGLARLHHVQDPVVRICSDRRTTFLSVHQDVLGPRPRQGRAARLGSGSFAARRVGQRSIETDDPQAGHLAELDRIPTDGPGRPGDGQRGPRGETEQVKGAADRQAVHRQGCGLDQRRVSRDGRDRLRACPKTRRGAGPACSSACGQQALPPAADPLGEEDRGLHGDAPLRLCLARLPRGRSCRVVAGVRRYPRVVLAARPDRWASPCPGPGLDRLGPLPPPATLPCVPLRFPLSELPCPLPISSFRIGS